MAKNKAKIKIKNYGIYTKWDRKTKDLPKIVEFTTQIPARLDIEFGYIINIVKGKGKKLSFIIDHPPFKDSKGNIAPPFEDELYINSNDYSFFLGDTVWEPVEDKIGPWRLRTFVDGEQVADMTLHLISS